PPARTPRNGSRPAHHRSFRNDETCPRKTVVAVGGGRHPTTRRPRLRLPSPRSGALPTPPATHAPSPAGVSRGAPRSAAPAARGLAAPSLSTASSARFSAALAARH